MKTPKRNSFRLLPWILISVLFLMASPVAAQPAVNGPTDPSELEAFLDGVLTAEMESNHIAGAVVAVVKDGEIFFNKGYGYADLAQHIPVDPERTLFRPGSVSKLFVWTAVMQLVEQGKLSLDTDVNEYLDFTIPDTYPEPITLKHLLTHTPGFEDIGEDLFKLSAEEMHPLDEYLKTHIPARVYPPGEIGAYSNYGTALAGYIVERVSGLPFAEYVEQNIFAPLQMEHSTFRQPLPENLASDMSEGYNFANGGYLEGGFEYVQAYPAGSLSATAADMARFMMAHLQNGRFGESQILQENTARQMQQQLFTHDPRLNGMAYGFFASTINGQRILSHGGDTILFHTGLFLIPEQNIGLFISTNSTGGAEVSNAVLNAFLDRYYPVEAATALQSPADFSERITPYLGAYTLARNNFSTFEKIISLTTPINASLNDEGYLVVSIVGQARQFVEVEPGLLQDRYDPSNQLVYRTDDEGQKLLLPSIPFGFIKTPWYGSIGWHSFLLVSGLLLFIVTMVGWFVAFLQNRRTRQPQPVIGRLARLAATLFGLLFLVFVLGFLSVFMDIDPAYGVPRIFFAEPPLFSLLMVLPVLILVVGLAMPVLAVATWRQRVWNTNGRILYTVLTVFALALLWVMVYWNLLL
ncbi:MAG: serine hydrolase [Anaerolineaceae bacterium]|nr:serine hydrolase [Anaerolineaceae bacterium]